MLPSGSKNVTNLAQIYDVICSYNLEQACSQCIFYKCLGSCGPSAIGAMKCKDCTMPSTISFIVGSSFVLSCVLDSTKTCSTADFLLALASLDENCDSARAARFKSA